MTITFFSNFLNHHQLYLCKEIIQQIGEENFHFVASECINEERTKMGYENMNIKYPFVIRSYESKEQMDYAIMLAHKSDVAIIGSSLQLFSNIRKKENKLTFLFIERLFKNGAWHRFYPPTALKIYNRYFKFRHNNFYALCASAYTANDLVLCGFPRKKCIKWGYFPELFPKKEKSFNKLRIMWCGRMLWWKHPEDAIEIARLLHEKGIDFEMSMIGNGEKKETIEKLIDKYNLRSKVFTFDFMPPTEIRKKMNESNVYLFTSGKQEGWGVVLNEAMNSGCVAIANQNAGSVPYLINDNINGIIYDGSYNGLKDAVERLLSMPIPQISENAYKSIAEVWNPRNAAKCLLSFVNNGNKVFDDGPCSLA